MPPSSSTTIAITPQVFILKILFANKINLRLMKCLLEVNFRIFTVIRNEGWELGGIAGEKFQLKLISQKPVVEN